MRRGSARLWQTSRLLHRGPTLADAALFGQVLLTGADLATLGIRSGDGVDIARWAVLAPFWFLPLVVLYRSERLSEVLRRTPVVWLVTFTTWAVCSAAWSVAARTGLLAAVAGFTLVVYAAWYSASYGARRFLTVVAAGLSTFCGIGVVVQGTLAFRPVLDGRWQGLAFSPTDLGLAAAIGVVVGTGLLCARIAPRTGLLTIALNGLALQLANARAATAAAIIGALFIIGATQRWRTVVTAVLGVLMLGGLVLWAGQTPVRDLTRSGDVRELTTLTGRTDVWRYTVAEVLDRPVFGFGAGSSDVLYGEATNRGDLWWEAHNAHNIVLAVGFELGAVGVVVLGGAVVALFRVRHRDRFALALVGTVLLTGVSEAVLTRPSVGLLVLAGVAAAGSDAAPVALGWRDRRALGAVTRSVAPWACFGSVVVGLVVMGVPTSGSTSTAEIVIEYERASWPLFDVHRARLVHDFEAPATADVARRAAADVGGAVLGQSIRPEVDGDSVTIAVRATTPDAAVAAATAAADRVVALSGPARLAGLDRARAEADRLRALTEQRIVDLGAEIDRLDRALEQADSRVGDGTVDAEVWRTASGQRVRLEAARLERESWLSISRQNAADRDALDIELAALEPTVGIASAATTSGSATSRLSDAIVGAAIGAFVLSTIALLTLPGSAARRAWRRARRRSSGQTVSAMS